MIMQEEEIREALSKHLQASAAADANANTIFTMKIPFVAILSQADESLGEGILQVLRSHHLGTPAGFDVRRILGKR